MTTKRNPQFNVRISPELKEEIVALAEKNKRPINAEINAALESWVEFNNISLGKLVSASMAEIGEMFSQVTTKITNIESKINKSDEVEKK